MSVTNVKSNWVGGNLVFSESAGGEILTLFGLATLGSHARSKRVRVTTAEVNAGLTLLPAISGYKYRLIDASLIAIGGAAGTADSVDIIGTQSTAKKLVAALVAALTENTLVKPNTANVNVLAAGVSFVANDANTAITIGKTGGSLATATHIDVILTYAIEAA